MVVYKAGACTYFFPDLKSPVFSSRCHYWNFWFDDVEIFWIYFNISMMLNKCIFWWLRFDVTTKAHFFGSQIGNNFFCPAIINGPIWSKSKIWWFIVNMSLILTLFMCMILYFYVLHKVCMVWAKYRAFIARTP